MTIRLLARVDQVIEAPSIGHYRTPLRARAESHRTLNSTGRGLMQPRRPRQPHRGWRTTTQPASVRMVSGSFRAPQEIAAQRLVPVVPVDRAGQAAVFIHWAGHKSALA